MRSYASLTRGGALLVTLVILAMFLVMAVATVGLINRQFKQIVGQEEADQAFQTAEAGINYASWLLDNGLVDYHDPQPIQGYQVTDQTKNPPLVLGTFDLTFSVISYAGPLGPAAVRVVSVGKSAVPLPRPETIEAVIASKDMDTFRITQWDHKP